MGLLKPNVNKMEAEKDIEGLVDALGYEKDSLVQLTARIALKTFGNAAVEPLIKGLKAKKGDTRLHAAMTLGEFADLRAVEPLIVLLQQDENEGVRKMAAGALAKLGDLRAVKPLENILENEKPTGKYDLRYEATVALQKLKVASKKTN